MSPASPGAPADPDELAALRAADRAARRLAQTDFSRPVVLEAGAGTGKTTTLVARVLAWCLGPGWERAEAAEGEAWRAAGRSGEPPIGRIAARVLDGVVAITFTEAAAAEMADRAARELARLAVADAEPPGWLVAPLPAPALRAARAAALLGALDHLVVRTIHAFCRGLLAEHPLAAGLHPELAVDADGSLVDEVARETVEAVLADAYGEDADGPCLALAARGFGPRELVEALAVLAAAGLPAEVLEADLLGREAVAGFRRRLADACRGLARAAAPALGGHRSPKSREAVAATAELAALAEDLDAPPHGPRLVADAGQPAKPANADREHPHAALARLLAAVADRFPDNLLARLKEWSKARWNATERDLFAGLEAEVSAAAGRAAALLAHARRLDPELLDLARRALAPLHIAARRELVARGVASFDDLLAEAARLLRSRPDVRRRLRLGIDQLLVDELQDTDRLQCDIVRLLALDGPPDERPGLFLVGDPKQSIYGWRNADLAAYEALVADVVAAGGVVRPLVENFRSVPAILEEVTRAVAPVMVADAGLQPRFERLLPCAELAGSPGFAPKDADAVPRGAVEHWVSWRPPRDAGDRRAGAATTNEAASEVEAEAIARDLADLHRRGEIAWRDAALLLRTTTSLDTYLEALRRHRVPFAVGRDTQYYRRREVIEAAALVRAVLDPGDHLALLTVLRSPLAGVPDAALVPLWRHGLPARVTELLAPDPHRLARIAEEVAAAAAEVPRDVPGIERVAGWPRALVAAIEALAAARHSFRHDPADVFVDTLRRRFLIEPSEAARYLGAYRLANLDRFFRQLTAALDEGGGDVTAALRALRKSVAQAREAEEGKPREGAEDAVAVMTIHQAKGLDFAHVYLPQLHRESGGDRTVKTEVARLADGFELRLFGAPTLGWDRVEAERARVEAAERVRLLYVATTRAEVRLVLCARWPEAPAPGELERAKHHLDLLSHREGTPEELGGRWELLVEQTDARAMIGGGGNRDTAAGPRNAGERDRPARAGDSAGLAGGSALAGPGDRRAASFRDVFGALWRFAALEAWPAGAEEADERPDLPDPARVAAESADLVARRRRAEARMARPFAVAASEEAHHRLREAMATEEVDDAAGDELPSRGAAMAAGTAVHRALEDLDPAADPAAELARLRAKLPAWVAQVASPADRGAALAEADAVLAALPGGRLWRRLAEIAPGIVARELPILLPADDGNAGPGGDAPRTPPPVAFLSGAVDLLYRDPADGAWAIADYKTDRLDDEDALADRAAIYAAQGAVYRRAVELALDLPAPPRFELWFLRADRVVEPDAPPAGAAARSTTPPAEPPDATGPIQQTLFEL